MSEFKNYTKYKLMTENKTITQLKDKVSAELYTRLVNERVLQLTLKREWYTKIACGYKKEEYREIKEYWARRFIRATTHSMEWQAWEEMIKDLQNPNERHWGYKELLNYFEVESKEYDLIIFKNGYGEVPTTIVECDGIYIKRGYVGWGANAEQFYFSLQIGNVLYTEPCCQLSGQDNKSTDKELMFSAEMLEKAYNDGVNDEQVDSGEFNIENYS